MKLHLGCNDCILHGYLNVDIAPPVDLIVDEILANDVFEHLADKIRTLNECWRVLKPGGRLRFQVPCVYNDVQVRRSQFVDETIREINPGAFADPTHRSFWTLDDRYYFGEEWNNPQGERGRLGPAYGIKALFRGKWQHVHYGTGAERRSKIVAELEAVKP